MWLSDVSVKRPVFATVIALLLVAFGTLAFNRLEVREYPDISAPVVSVNVNYSGLRLRLSRAALRRYWRVKSAVSKASRVSIPGVSMAARRFPSNSAWNVTSTAPRMMCAIVLAGWPGGCRMMSTYR